MAKPTTVKQYLAALPADRKAALEAIIEVIEQNRDPALEHGMQYGMPAWYVPHAVYPAGYHCKPSEPLPFASVASQKNHIGLYFFCTYTDQEEKARFVEAWTKTGKKLDMGASCVRVKTLEGIPLDVVAKTMKRMTVKKFIKAYEGALGGGQWSTKKAGAKKTAKKAAKKTATKKGSAKKGTPKTTTTSSGGSARVSSSSTTVTRAPGGKSTVKKKSTRAASKRVTKKVTKKSSK